MTTETKPETKTETKPAEKPSRAARMREFFTDNPKASVRDVAALFGTTYQIAYMVRKDMLDKAKKQAKKVVAPKVLPTAKEKSDPVNHPAHYKVGGIETIDFIEAKKLNYNLGNVVKYITRSDHKGNRKQDLEKALWYLNREISSMP